MIDETKKNNQLSFSSFIKNKNYKMNSHDSVRDKNISSKIQFLMKKNARAFNKNSDLIFLKNNIGINLNTIEENKDEEKFRKQSIGINTSELSENIKLKTKKVTKIKPKVNIIKPYTELFKKYFISYEENKKTLNNPEPLKKESIPKFSSKLNQKFKTISSFPKKKKTKNIYNRTIPMKNRNKESLLTYNFNKDAYYKEERLLLNISGNNFGSIENNVIHNRLKKTKTNKSFKTMIFSNIDLKSMSNKTKKNKKFKLFNRTNLFHDSPNDNILMDHSVNKDIKNSFCNSLLKNVFSNEENKKIIMKANQNNFKKEEITKLMEYPDSVFSYILQKLKEYNTYHGQRNGFRKKLENMKTDLKLTEQRALYELINLKYDRVPGDEINIRTNLFCIKNKNLSL